MESNRRVFLARSSKAGSHFLFEVVPSGYRSARLGTLDIPTMNKLVQWKGLDDLVAVLEETGPLIAQEVCGGAGRLITVREAVSIAEAGGHGQESQGFCPNDPASLRMQLYLDGRAGAYPSRASVAKACAAHGLLESAALEDLRRWAEEDPDAMVAVEPVADLVLARNLCSLMLRVVANCQDPDIEDVLEASGFSHRAGEGPHIGRYMIPLQPANEIDGTVRFSWKWGGSVPARKAAAQLGCLMGEAGAGEGGHGFGLGGPAGPMSLLGKARCCEGDGALECLAVCDDVPPREAAQRLIEGVCAIVSGLSMIDGDRPAPLGWGFSRIPSVLSNEAPVPVFRTLFSAMVGTVAYRDGKIPAKCKNCGNAFFDRPKGKHRAFCSASCRTLHSAPRSVPRFSPHTPS